MDLTEVGVGNVGVDLCSADIRVAEEGLDGADVCAVNEEVGSEGMSEGVRGNMFSNTGDFCVFFDNTLDRARGETAKITVSLGNSGITTII